jgi:hypothetical protein
MQCRATAPYTHPTHSTHPTPPLSSHDGTSTRPNKSHFINLTESLYPEVWLSFLFSAILEQHQLRRLISSAPLFPPPPYPISAQIRHISARWFETFVAVLSGWLNLLHRWKQETFESATSNLFGVCGHRLIVLARKTTVHYHHGRLKKFGRHLKMRPSVEWVVYSRCTQSHQTVH